MKNYIMINDLMVNDKYNAVIAGLTRNLGMKSEE
jgi:hypothetical protein